MSNDAKLAELRARTDREVSVLILRELERALALGDVAVNRESDSYCQASEAYRRVVRLLLKATGMRRGESALIEEQVRVLRLRLDHAVARARAELHQASFATGA